MVAALLGKKIGMTRVYDDQGVMCPVTVVQAGPCSVLAVKSADGADGYNAIQLGFQDLKPARATRPLIGHAKRAGVSPKKYAREVRIPNPADYEMGQELSVASFGETDVKLVDVTGVSKGRGFAGAMKRHGFGGLRASHGTERKHRAPGSISSHGSDLGHGGNVKKGKKMAGHMGNVRRTVSGQRLVAVDTENHLLLIKGAVPGPNGGLVLVRESSR